MFSNDLKRLINKYAQIPHSLKEEMKLKETSEKPEFIEPEQMALPGIEPGFPVEQGPGELATRNYKDYKKNEDAERLWNDRQIGISDYQYGIPGLRGKLEFQTGESQKNEWVEMYKTKHGVPVDFTFPAPNYFPELSDEELSVRFETLENNRQRIDRMLQKTREKFKDNPEKMEIIQGQLLDSWELSQNSTDTSYSFSTVKNEYNKFRQLYAQWYPIYRESVYLQKKIPNPFRKMNQMKAKPLAESLKEIGSLLKDAVNYVAVDIIARTTFDPAIFSKYTDEQSIQPYIYNSLQIEKSLYTWNKRLELMSSIQQDFEEKFDKLMNDKNFFNMIRMFDQSYPKFKDHFFDRIFRALGLLHYNYYEDFMSQIRNISDNTTSILQSAFDKLHYISDYSKNSAQDQFRELIKDEYNRQIIDLFQPIIDRTIQIKEELKKNNLFSKNPVSEDNMDAVRRIDDLFQEVKQMWSPYCDLATFDKMINFGVIVPGGQKSVTPRIKLAWMTKVIGNLSNNDLLRQLTEWPMNNIYEDLATHPDHESRLRALPTIAKKHLIEDVKYKLNRKLTYNNNNYSNNVPNWADEIMSKTHLNDINHIIISSDNKDFTGRGMITEILKSLDISEEDQTIVKKYFQKLLKNGMYDKLNDFHSSDKKFIILCAIKILKKVGKFSIDNLENLVEKLPKIPVDSYLNNLDLFSYNVFIDYLPSDLSSVDDASNIVAASVRSLESLHNDLPGVMEISKIIHNNADEMDDDLLMGMLQTKNVATLKRLNAKENKFEIMDSARKFYELMTKIIGAGGYQAIVSKYGDTIDKLKANGSISKDIEEKLQDFADIIRQGRELNPSNPSFKEDIAMIVQLDSDIDMILQAELYQAYYAEAEKFKKNEKLFDLNLKVNDHVRFRVLEDMDPKHFRVGAETQCCQRPGGVGEMAMIDSFVNDLAGVLVLEVLNNQTKEWELAAQSYFHYVPPGSKGSIGEYNPPRMAEDDDDDEIMDNWDDDDEYRVENMERKKGGYILDNVESSEKYSNGIDGIPLEQYYAYWALKKKEELGIGFIESGAGYSGISSNEFGSSYWNDDPRKFHVNDPYTDWHPNDSNLDLLNPDFEITIPGITPSADKIASLSWDFLRMTLGVYT